MKAITDESVEDKVVDRVRIKVCISPRIGRRIIENIGGEYVAPFSTINAKTKSDEVALLSYEG